MKASKITGNYTEDIDRERNKFVECNGKVCVRLQLSTGSSAQTILSLGQLEKKKFTANGYVRVIATT